MILICVLPCYYYYDLSETMHVFWAELIGNETKI